MAAGEAQPRTAARQPRTASRAVRRRQLIEATIDSIAEHGLSGTTMATVTGQAGLSMGIVSFHFDSKENLLIETLVYLAQEHRDRWIEAVENAALAPQAKLTALIDASFQPEICTPRKLAVWFAFFGERRYREAYHDRCTGFDRERFAVIGDLCRRIIEDGCYDGLDPNAVTQSIETMTDGLWLSIMVYPDWLTREEGRRRMQSFMAQTFPRHFAKPAP